MKVCFSVLAVITTIVLLVSCRDNSLSADDCKISLNNVVFTKSLNDASKLTAGDNESGLLMKSGPGSDYFNEPDGSARYGNAPVLLTAIDNTRPFTLTVKVTPEFDTTYDAGAMYIYINDDLWQKFAFERDERSGTRIVTVRTVNTSDDNNHDVVSSSSVFMKISSDTRSIGFYYSVNDTLWQLVRVYKNSYPEKIWAGISSQSPLGNGINTLFEECDISSEAVKNFRTGI